MAKRKRTARRSSLVGRAVTAGRKALKEAESRVPADLRRQVERRVRDANKTVQAAIKEAQAQVRRASSRADVNSFLKRLDGLVKQATQLAVGAAPKPASTRRAATSRKPAAKIATRRPAVKRTATPRRRAAPTTPAVTEATTSHPAETPRAMGETPPMG